MTISYAREKELKSLVMCMVEQGDDPDSIIQAAKDAIAAMKWAKEQIARMPR